MTNVLLGETNDAEWPTTLRNVWNRNPVLVVKGEMGTAVMANSWSNPGLFAESAIGTGVHGKSTSGGGVYGESGGGTGVRGVGSIGVHGDGPHNVGVYGESVDGSGVRGQSNSGVGVQGVSQMSTGVSGSSKSNVGVFGSSDSGAGVQGWSTDGIGVAARSKSSNAVHGSCSSPSASGVYGSNESRGYGIAGRSNAAPLGQNGVWAAATLGDNTADGIGVWARSAHGIGLYADGIHPDAVALNAKGVAQFSRSGQATIQAGQSSFTHSGIRLDPGSLILATLQQDRPGIHVRSAVPDRDAGSFTVTLSQAVSADTVVGWFVVN